MFLLASNIGGSDYISETDSFLFDPVGTNYIITITLIDDMILEFNESFFVDLSTDEVGVILTPTSAVITIIDDDSELKLQ